MAVGPLSGAIYIAGASKGAITTADPDWKDAVNCGGLCLGGEYDWTVTKVAAATGVVEWARHYGSFVNSGYNTIRDDMPAGLVAVNASGSEVLVVSGTYEARLQPAGQGLSGDMTGLLQLDTAGGILISRTLVMKISAAGALTGFVRAQLSPPNSGTTMVTADFDQFLLPDPRSTTNGLLAGGFSYYDASGSSSYDWARVRKVTTITTNPSVTNEVALQAQNLSPVAAGVITDSNSATWGGSYLMGMASSAATAGTTAIYICGHVRYGSAFYPFVSKLVTQPAERAFSW